MNTVIAFYNQQYGYYKNTGYDTALGRLCVHESDNWKGITPSTYSADFNPEPPIFSAKFANCESYRNILAIANEDGKIALQDTNKKLPEITEEKSLEGVQCHFNAVFDLEWMPGQMKFVSASGDHSAKLWEVRQSNFEQIRIFNGHSRSVKTAAFRKTDPSTFATGGRDGAILIWDTRASVNVGAMPKADNCIYSGHAGVPGTPQSMRRGTRCTPKLPSNVLSSSITGLVFQDDFTLISCGAGDGIIKVWDLRRNYTSFRKEPQPKYSINYSGTSTFKGFTNLLVDNCGVKLYVNCMDNNIYCYNLATYSSEPIRKYSGLRNNTFYIKSCLSPDNKYLLSGSSDDKAFIWNINESEPLVALSGHTVEVTCVAWSNTNELKIVTCSDDARHKLWRIGKEQIDDDEKIFYRGVAELCRTTIGKGKRIRNGKVNGLKTTPLNNKNGFETATPKSLKRLIKENETTPTTIEMKFKKRTYSDLCKDDNYMGNSIDGYTTCNEQYNGRNPKRLNLDQPRARCLFDNSPSTSSHHIDVNAIDFNCLLLPILEENEKNDRKNPNISNSNSPSKNNRNNNNSNNNNNNSPNKNNNSNNCNVSNNIVNDNNEIDKRIMSPIKENTMHLSPLFGQRLSFNDELNELLANRNRDQPEHSTVTSVGSFSPTLNLPNYVIDGEAPHLQLNSPKRKLKENVDWLTKMRKQKLLTTLNNKQYNNNDKLINSVQQHNGNNNRPNSPKTLIIDSTASEYTPKSRQSRSASNSECSPQMKSTTTTTTTTPTRRISETTLLRFFTITNRSKSCSSK